MITRFFLGMSLPLKGVRVVFSSTQLFFISMIPFLICSILFWFGLIYGSPYVGALVAKALTWVFPTPEGILYNILFYPILVIFWIVFAVGVTGFVYLLTSVLASPFNGLLAERVLMKMGAIKDAPFSVSDFLGNSIRMFMVSILRSLVLLSIASLLFVVSFVPALNIICAFVTFVILGFDSADYSFEARRLSLGSRFSYFKKHQFIFYGMGASVGLIALVPGLLIVMMPFLVAGFAVISSQLEAQYDDTRSNT
jgi:CysZ protein